MVWHLSNFSGTPALLLICLSSFVIFTSASTPRSHSSRYVATFTLRLLEQDYMRRYGKGGSRKHRQSDNDAPAQGSSRFFIYRMTANPLRRSARLSTGPQAGFGSPLISACLPRIARLRRRASLQFRLGSSRRGNGLVKRTIPGGLVRPMLVVVVCMDGARYRHERQQE